MSLLAAKVAYLLSLFFALHCAGLTSTRNVMLTQLRRKLVNLKSFGFHLFATKTETSTKDTAKKGAGVKTQKPKGETGKTLVIVESPAKAKTIQKILSSENYVVESCYGHVRDLSKSVRAAEEDYQREYVSKELRLKVANLGVDVFNDFAPVYVAVDRQVTVIERLRKLARDCDLVVLATDEDREGEAISWHLLEVLQPKVPHKRAVFHEITKTAILESFQNLRDIDMNLVHSQETRRILDRLTGYTLSPVLWRYISFGLSAGRVQSCGLKLIVERERKRWDFVSGAYYSVVASLYTSPADSSNKQSNPALSLPCKLHSVNGRRVAGDKDFDDKTGALKDASADSDSTSKGSSRSKQALAQPLLLTEDITVDLLSWLSGVSREEVRKGVGDSSTTCVPAEFRVSEVDRKQVQRTPPVPLITSSLQQEASSKLGLSPARTMSVAQELYEKGYITYMRTDSPKLSDQAVEIGTALIKRTFGDEYLGTSASATRTAQGKKKAAPVPKNAQEAHEAIRPAAVEMDDGSNRFYQPGEISFSSDMHRALYVLILQRTLASLMAPSVSDSTTYTITARRSDTGAISPDLKIEEVKLRTSATELRFKGFTAVFDLWKNSGEGAASDFSFQQYVSGKDQGGASPLAGVRENDPLWLRATSPTASTTWIANGDAADTESAFETDSETEASEDDAKSDSMGSTPDLLSVCGIRGTQHRTRPPVRFTESSFIRELEEIGVGRPSTYSSIFQKLKEREYVLVDKRSILPTVKGILVTKLLERHFQSVVDSNFTAIMESQLDAVAKGQRNKLDFLRQFYLGGDSSGTGLLPRVEALVAGDTVDHAESRSIRLPFLKDIDCEMLLTSSGLVVEKVDPATSSKTRWGLPTNMQLDIRQLTSEAVRNVMETQLTTEGSALGLADSGDGSGPKPVYMRSGRFGKYLQVGENTDKTRRTCSLPNWVDESASQVDLLSFIDLPQVVCVHPELNIPIVMVVKYGQMSLQLQGFTLQRNIDNVMPRDVTTELAVSLFSDLNATSWQEMYLGDFNGAPVLVCPTKSNKGFYLRSGPVFAALSRKDKEGLTLARATEILTTKGRTLGKKATPKATKATKALSKPSSKEESNDVSAPAKAMKTTKATSKSATSSKTESKPRSKKAPVSEKPTEDTKVKRSTKSTATSTVTSTKAKKPTRSTTTATKKVAKTASSTGALTGYRRYMNAATADGVKYADALSRWQGMSSEEKNKFNAS